MLKHIDGSGCPDSTSNDEASAEDGVCILNSSKACQSSYRLNRVAGVNKIVKKPLLSAATYIAPCPEALLAFKRDVAEMQEVTSREGRWSPVVKLSNIAQYYSYASMQDQLGVWTRLLKAARAHARRCVLSHVVRWVHKTCCLCAPLLF